VTAQDPHPAALAHQLFHHYGLSGDTASLLRSVLVQGRAHELGSALLAVAGLMIISSYVMGFWVDLYARDYGGFGVVLAIYFWIAFSSAVIVWAASLSPVVAERRNLRRIGAA
jgi:uncharacterized BrkB/YihY/UPF0761 family membrane protein